MIRTVAAASNFVRPRVPLPVLCQHLAPSVTTTAPTTQRRFVHVENRISELGITLPAAPKPAANYNIICHASGDIMYVSGHLPFQSDGTLMTGVIGPDGNVGNNTKSLDEGYVAARHCGLNIISTLKRELGDLDRVAQVIKVFGIVNSTTDFKYQHKVMDGCSDVMMEVFGQPVGYHARSAIGTNTLPLDIMVEVEAIVQIKPAGDA